MDKQYGSLNEHIAAKVKLMIPKGDLLPNIRKKHWVGIKTIQWLAMDKNGDWFLFETKPEHDDIEWVPITPDEISGRESFFCMVGTTVDDAKQENWINTLTYIGGT